MFGSNSISTCCELPLIWTFIFPGSEWFCMECKHAYPMMNAPDQIEATEENKKLSDDRKKAFHELTEDYIAPTVYHRDCEKCGNFEEYHILHVSDEAIKKSAEIYERVLK